MIDFKFWLKSFILVFGLILVWMFIIASSVKIIKDYNSKARNEIEKEYQRQAVSNNFANWEVNSLGEVTFKWNNRE